MSKLTIREAFAQRVYLLRRDPWEPSSRLKLFISDDGLLGPWAAIEDGLSDAGHREAPSVGTWELDLDERAWEPWVKSE
jgi:hypothetical protein